MPVNSGDDLEAQVRQLLRSYKGVAAVVAVRYKTPGGKSGEVSYIIQTTGDEDCHKLAQMLMTATDVPPPANEVFDDSDD